MTIEIKVPAMGESVTEATLVRWFKKEGESVTRDEPLLELETDKVTVEVPAPASGAIELISVQAGSTVQVGTILGAIAEDKTGSATTSAVKPSVEAGAPKSEAAPKPNVEAPKPVAPPQPKAEKMVMPSARRIAEETGLEPASVAGTGKDARVTKGDMLSALEARARERAPTAAPRPSGPRPNAAREERVAMSRLRKTIALRLKESQNSAAQLHDLQRG